MTAAKAEDGAASARPVVSQTGGAAKSPPLAISVRGVSKAYRVYDKPAKIVSEVLFGRKAHREKPVLQDINIDMQPGEVVGIIGRNGAGKSTLLKLIAGTLAPSTGKIELRGRVSAILELGTGFNPSYSGRDNVIMSAIMRGMPEAAIKAKFDSIVAFAGLADVIDQPFHTYSSGMQARLSFAAAVAVEADVIIIDEALAAGDIRFTARSLRRVREICASGVTALFVSHQTYHVMQLCSRAIWIDDGRVKMDGPPIEVCRAYEYAMHAEIARDEGRHVSNMAAAANPFSEDAAAEAVSELDPSITEEPDGPAVDEPDRGEADTQVAEPVQAAYTPEQDGSAPMPAEIASDEGGHDSSVAAAPEPVSENPPTEAAPDLDPTVRDELAGRHIDEPKLAETAMQVAEPVQPQGVDPEPDGADAADYFTVSAVPPTPEGKPAHFQSNQYRIGRIEFLNAAGEDTRVFKFGEAFRLRVSYECLLDDVPDASCGLAAAFTSTPEHVAVMYFNTNYPHSDEEMRDYDEADYRRYRGRTGVVEASIPFLQVKPGTYLISLGILPNRPEGHEFYEYHHLAFPITVLPNGFPEPSVFYAMVDWTNGPDGLNKSNRLVPGEGNGVIR